MRGKHKAIKGISYTDNSHNKFRVIFCHYTANPLKRSAAWKKREMEGKADIWEQDYELNPARVGGTPVFGNLYKSAVHNAKSEYVEGEILYRSWDFGWVHPACVVSKINNIDQWHLMKEWMGTKINNVEWWPQVVAEQEKLYPNANWYDSCDPSGKRHEGTSGKTYIQLLGDLHIYPSFRVMWPKDMCHLVKIRLSIRKDGKPRMLVDEEGCPIIVEAFQGGYILSNTKDGNPKKDGYYEHLMDAVQFIAVSIGGGTAGKDDPQLENPYFMGDPKTGY